MNTLRTTSLCAFSAAVLLSTHAGAAIVFRDNVPDFYQHQKTDLKNFKGTMIPDPLVPAYNSPDWWENAGGGWCATGAWTNAIASQESKFAGIFDNSRRKGADKTHATRSWLERANYAYEDLAMVAGTRFGLKNGACAWKPDVIEYSKKAGYDKAIVDEYVWDAGKVSFRDDTGKKTDAGFSTMLSFINQAMKGNRAVVIYLGPGTNTTAWWSSSFHVVTPSAVDVAASQIWFADPDNTFRGGGFDTATHSYIDGRYKNTDDTPWGDPRDPKVSDKYYSKVSLKDGYIFQDGPYKGAEILEVYTYAVPTPGSVVLAGLGALASFRRRR